MHGDFRPFRQEDRCWLGLQCRSKIGAVEILHVAVKCCFARRPDSPSWVTDAILHASAIGLGSIAPVVLGDKLLLGAFFGKRGSTHYTQLHSIPERARFPGILDRTDAAIQTIVRSAQFQKIRARDYQ